MPITSWLTINGGYYQDKYESYSYGLYYDYTYDDYYDVFYFGAELHIPLGDYLGF